VALVIQAAAAHMCFAQTAEDVKFDVVSIRPTSDPSRSTKVLSPSGLWTMENDSASGLICYAYGVRSAQIAGLPDWGTSEHFDIRAKSEPDSDPRAAITRTKLRVKAMLRDRFGLVLRRETKDARGLALVVGKQATTLRTAEPSDAMSGDSTPTKTSFRGMTMGAFAKSLSSRLGQPVVDETDLKGQYNFELEFDAEAPQPSSEEWVAAINRLGLRLVNKTVKVDMLVVEQINRPTGN
jgi:uncharacterized protein (TIGR03435 family)